MLFHLTPEGERVEIPDTDLHKAPDSVLSIAARHPHDGESMAVPTWPGASFEMLKVCYAHSTVLHFCNGLTV